MSRSASCSAAHRHLEKSRDPEELIIAERSYVALAMMRNAAVLEKAFGRSAGYGTATCSAKRPRGDRRQRAAFIAKGIKTIYGGKSAYSQNGAAQ